MAVSTLGNRVVIIGSPGAGKTYLSRALATKLDLPIIHLDKYFHEADKDYLRDDIAWRRLVNNLAAQENWIMEGNYMRTTFDIKLPIASTIIYLDYPSRVAIRRVIKRRIQYHKKLRPEMPETWREKIDLDFFKFVVRFRKNDRPSVLKELKKYPETKIITLCSPKETKKFLASL